ncbi:MAG: hypothetical protein H0X68_04410 [Chloroflexi bacterium]|jgi:uncharacterized protein CbrC (UPF0167 family)|nr:hypothetical protein [Chloroflexota bacterium]
MEAIEKATGNPADEIVEVSTPTICAFRIGDGEASHDASIRFEDVFASLDSVKASFTEGESSEVAARPSYWAPGLHTMWVHSGDSLIAVQLLHADLEEAAALELAERLAAVAVHQLAP